MKHITSESNSRIRNYHRLLRKKYRDREGRYLVEGDNLVREAAVNGHSVEAVLIRENSSFSGEKEISFYEDFGAEVFLLPERIFSTLTETVTSQGILGVVRKRRDTLKDLVLRDTPESAYIVLDRLQDPGNIGSVFRTAEAVGISGVILLKGTGDPYSPKTVRAAAGSLFRLPVVTVSGTRELIDLKKRLKKELVVTCPGNGIPYYTQDIGHGTFLVIGNEGNGCAPELIRHGDLLVTIPMEGKIESLNASVAAAILMYERIRRCGNADN